MSALPNVFTAFADIVLGSLVGWYVFGAGHGSVSWLTFVLLLASSACLYCAGMVFNDVFDVEQDRRERPFRPLPSGRVTVRRAAAVGAALMVAGLACAAAAGVRPDGFAWLPLTLAALMSSAILLYDGWLKRTWAGPLGMGACRFLNVLLGLAIVEQPSWGFNVYLALIVGLYIVGVTLFAHGSTAEQPVSARGAAALMLASLVLAVLLPGLPRDVLPATRTTAVLFPYLLIGFGYAVGYPIVRAILDPVPKMVQKAVKQAILGLVVLDAILASGLVGVIGLVILLLLPPAMFVGRWIYST